MRYFDPPLYHALYVIAIAIPPFLRFFPDFFLPQKPSAASLRRRGHVPIKSSRIDAHLFDRQTAGRVRSISCRSPKPEVLLQVDFKDRRSLFVCDGRSARTHGGPGRGGGVRSRAARRGDADSRKRPPAPAAPPGGARRRGFQGPRGRHRPRREALVCGGCPGTAGTTNQEEKKKREKNIHIAPGVILTQYCCTCH